MNKKKIIIIPLVILLIFLILWESTRNSLVEYALPLVSETSNSEELTERLTKDEAREDLRALWGSLEEYHVMFAKGNKNIWHAKHIYNRVKTSIKDDISVLELWRSMAQIVSALHDPHTEVSYISEENRELQIQNFEMEDTINGIPINDLYKHFLQLYSYDQINTAKYKFESELRNEKTLNLLGINTSHDIIYEKKGTGEIQKLYFKPININMDDNNCQYQIYKEQDLAVFSLKSCILNMDYMNSLQNFFGEIQNSNINRIILDLRDNIGGDSSVISEFIKYLDVQEYYVSGKVIEKGNNTLDFTDKYLLKNEKVDNPFDGEVYILTSTKTFSSATLFAMVIQDNKIGKVIGATPGNMPEGYGDIKKIQFDNSKLVMTVSTKYFYRIDESKSEQPIVPDYKLTNREVNNIDFTSKDFLSILNSPK